MRDDYTMSRDERGSSAGRSDNMPFHVSRSNIPNSRYAKIMRTEKEEKGTNIQVVVRCRLVNFKRLQLFQFAKILNFMGS